MPKNFLSKAQENKIIAAIKQAEMRTSGEIRVHIENNAKIKTEPLKHAEKIFAALNMHDTKARNAVLFYVDFDSHALAIYGDKGIHDVVGGGFWNDTYELVRSSFRRGEYVEGLIKGIANVGEKLKSCFPYDGKTDTNELSDDISYGTQA